MFPLCILVVLLCLQCGGVYNAIHIMDMLDLQVELGESATLPCNGSAFLEMEGSVLWEAMGKDLAILRGGEPGLGEKFKSHNSFQDRVQLPTEEQLREGDWSVVLQNTMFSDTDVYECILEGRKTISTVWLTVTVPQLKHMKVTEGNLVNLSCYIPISRSQSLESLQVWWTKNGSIIGSIQDQIPVIPYSEDIPRMSIWTDDNGFNNKVGFHLMIHTVMSDTGDYDCLYKTRDSDNIRPGEPKRITVIVLETNPIDIVFQPDETSTATEDWVSTSLLPVTTLREEVNEVETTETPLDPTPVLLEDSTQPTEGTPETSESPQLNTLPWVRTGLIAGVLLVTVVVLCILGALRKI